jgi:CRP/FNR family transcriptional regulator, cyclic AMP receptor protein
MLFFGHRHSAIPDQHQPVPMSERDKTAFDPAVFLANAGLGRKTRSSKGKDNFFSQGNRADAIFYLQSGRAKLTVLSKEGKEATIAMISAGDLVGEKSVASVGERHLATATAITACTAMKVESSQMIRVMHEEYAFSDLS